MKRISIERYPNATELDSAGLIEGESDDGRRWIIFMDEKGAPELYWPDRDPDGGVRGKPTTLWHSPGKTYGTSDHPMTWEEMCAEPRVSGETEPLRPSGDVEDEQQ